MKYYARVIGIGPMYYREPIGKVPVSGSPYRRDVIGRAECVGRDEGGVAVWKLIVRGQDMPDEFCIINGVFVPAG